MIIQVQLSAFVRKGIVREFDSASVFREGGQARAEAPLGTRDPHNFLRCAEQTHLSAEALAILHKPNFELQFRYFEKIDSPLSNLCVQNSQGGFGEFRVTVTLRVMWVLFFASENLLQFHFLGESDGARSTGVTAQGSDGADREI